MSVARNVLSNSPNVLMWIGSSVNELDQMITYLHITRWRALTAQIMNIVALYYKTTPKRPTMTQLVRRMSFISASAQTAAGGCLRHNIIKYSF